MKIFETLLDHEESHIDFLESQIDLHDRIGAGNYAQLNASTMDEGS